MSSHNDTGPRHCAIQLQPTSVKQLDYLIAVDSGHARGWWVSQHVLERIGARGPDTLSLV
ncbi:hypothetical protein KSC_106440 [Ktedonobacter sp. SOSP1-52]|nr:hypothetical protein KSC_106440 [Ktedonobacter sp. SOSP1-52]